MEDGFVRAKMARRDRQKAMIDLVKDEEKFVRELKVVTESYRERLMVVLDKNFQKDRFEIVGNVEAILNFHANVFLPQLSKLGEGGETVRLIMQFHVVAADMARVFRGAMTKMTEEHVKHAKSRLKSAELRQKYADILKREYDTLASGKEKIHPLEHYLHLPEKRIAEYASLIDKLMESSKECREQESEASVADATMQALKDVKTLVDTLSSRIEHTKHLSRIVVREEAHRIEKWKKGEKWEQIDSAKLTHFGDVIDFSQVRKEGKGWRIGFTARYTYFFFF